MVRPGVVVKNASLLAKAVLVGLAFRGAVTTADDIIMWYISKKVPEPVKIEKPVGQIDKPHLPLKQKPADTPEKFVQEYTDRAKRVKNYLLYDVLEGFEGAGWNTVSHTDGFSAGRLQYNPFALSITQITNKYFSRYPTKSKEVFGNWRARLRTEFAKAEDSKKSRELVDLFKRNYDTMKTMYQKMFGSPEGIALQLEDANHRLMRSVDTVDKYGLETEWATAVAFNCSVHMGINGMANRFAVLEKVKRDEINTKEIFKTYLEPKYRQTFAGRSDLEQFIAHKRTWFAALHTEAQKDQYMLCLVADDINRYYKSDLAARRVFATIGFDAQQDENGRWANGGIVYKDQFFTFDEELLGGKRVSYSRMHDDANRRGIDITKHADQARRSFIFQYPDKKQNTLLAERKAPHAAERTR